MKLKPKTHETSMKQGHVKNFVVPDRRIKEDGRYTRPNLLEQNKVNMKMIAFN
jgi:hypothetical protein